MLAGVPITLALVACVEGGRYDSGPKFGRRFAFNETASAYTNTSTSISTSSTTSSSTSTSSRLFTTSPSNPDSSPTQSPQLPTTSSNDTTSIPTCIGLVTYYGSVPPTVYLTVTEGFDVTVTASNASVTASDTLVTPPPACTSTIVPLLGSFQPLATIEISSAISIEASGDLSHTATTEAITAVSSGVDSWPPSHNPQVQTTNNIGGPRVSPQAPPTAPTPALQSGNTQESWSIVKSTIYATAPYTSTVIVTKKTPVIVVSPQTSAPPVFQAPGPPSNNNPPPPPNNPGVGAPPSPPNNNPPAASNGPNINPPPAPSQGPAVVPGPVAPTNTGIGNIIVSLIKTQNFAPVPTAVPQTTVANVPVVVLPSSVLIGTSAIAIPQSGESIATVNGQTFTVRPTEIAAPSGQVVPLAGPHGVQMQPSLTTRVTIAPGLIATVGDSTAVIQGTTYRIGYGATPTEITLSGYHIGIGPYGLALPSTTVAANAITAGPLVVESAGGLIFSIGPSEVIVDGTTFRIGSGAPELTTEVDGQTLSIGPGGVGLKTTTLLPTTAETAAGGSQGAPGAAATSSASIQDSGAGTNIERIGMKEMLGWMLMAAVGE